MDVHIKDWIIYLNASSKNMLINTRKSGKFGSYKYFEKSWGVKKWKHPDFPATRYFQAIHTIHLLRIQLSDFNVWNLFLLVMVRTNISRYGFISMCEIYQIGYVYMAVERRSSVSHDAAVGRGNDKISSSSLSSEFFKA